MKEESRMKKVLFLTLAVMLVFAFAMGCAANVTPPETSSAAPADTSSTSVEPEKSAAEESQATSADFNPADYPLGLCHILKTHPVVQIMMAGFIEEAKQLGYPYYLYQPDDADTAKAYSLAEAGVTQHGIKGMVQYIFDDGTAMYIKKWADMGIAVTSAHTYIAEEDKDKWPGLLAWASCSAEEYGKAAAKAIGEKVGGKGVVAVTEGGFNTTEDAAAAAFTAEMNKSYPDIVVLEPQEEGYDTPTAIQRATAIVQANPDIVGAFSTTGAGPSTWAGAKANTGKDICIISMDYSETNLDLVKNGEVYALVAQPLYHEFALAVDLLDKHFRGEEIEWANVMDAPLITTDNVDEYYELIEKVNEIMKNI
jgi:ribose transport system substrate-binding protein